MTDRDRDFDRDIDAALAALADVCQYGIWLLAIAAATFLVTVI